MENMIRNDCTVNRAITEEEKYIYRGLSIY
jgi:hypothetical protein